MLNSNTKKIIVVLSLFILVPLLIIAISYISSRGNQGKIKVEILAVPSYATTTIDGETVKKSTVYLSPGVYTFETKQEGFETQKRSIKIDQTERTVTMALVPISEQADKWAKDNQNAYLKAEGAEGEEADAEGQALIAKNPIIQNLPYTDPLYNINYGTVPGSDTVYILIDAETPSPVARQAAVERIRSWGYEPTEYIIVFSDFKNPFSGTVVEAPNE